MNKTQLWLKSETDTLHKSIEQTWLMTQLMSSSLAVEQYQLTLNTWLKWLLNHQPAIETHLPESFSDIFTDRISLIKLDLKQLSFPSHDIAREAQKSAANGLIKPLVNNAEQALGAMYVLEGSSLGGLVVKKRVQSVLGKDIPTHFYQNSKTGAPPATRFDNWHKFVKQLDHFVLSRGTEGDSDYLRCLDQMSTGAKATFSSLIDQFEQTDEAHSASLSQLASPTYQSEATWA